MSNVPKFSINAVEQIARGLGDCLTGGEIGPLLSSCGIQEPASEHSTKWRRLNATFLRQQDIDNGSDRICHFIQILMDPVRFVGRSTEFEGNRSYINQTLCFSGLELNKSGKIEKVKKVDNLSDAEERANSLSSKLRGRNVHSEVLKYCRSELMQDNYFHAVLEASKSVAERVRRDTGLGTDGAALFDEAFSVQYPLLAMNKLHTESEQSEQKGFINFLKGIFGLFRNPHAHTAKIVWSLDEHDALDLLVMVSYAHRKLDKCFRTPFQIRIK